MVENVLRTSGYDKYYYMIKQTNSQLMQEHEAWKRSLEFYKQENALLKFRLSEMVDESEGDHFLQTAEYFQNEFLKTDEWLTKLTHSLQSIQDNNSNHLKEQTLDLQNKLRQRIGQFERDFIELSIDFNLKVQK